ncbi:hypothetical protein [Paenibacillus sp. sgz5001063]|uniref:hypothetical protein n=1 Tax=Paenibacillus sp. sgz5001063 TaxID=3242474 RepID=UPI0036D2E70B
MIFVHFTEICYTDKWKRLRIPLQAYNSEAAIPRIASGGRFSEKYKDDDGAEPNPHILTKSTEGRCNRAG